MQALKQILEMFCVSQKSFQIIAHRLSSRFFLQKMGICKQNSHSLLGLMSHPQNYRFKGPQIGSVMPSALGLFRIKNGKRKNIKIK